MTTTARPVVTVSAGALRGRVPDDAGVVAFLGIRYGRASRFTPPRAAPSWEGVRDAVEHGPVSPQQRALVAAVTGPSGEDTAVQGEDCLRLDVRVPSAALTDGVQRPVLVWVHGGAYVIASGPAPPGGTTPRGSSPKATS